MCDTIISGGDCMNLENCGKFISVLRKEKNLTQKELAEKLNVSDKAISKWETGKGYPDISSLMAMSEYFGVTVNEILAGKRVEKEKFSELAEENIVSVIENKTKAENKGKIQTIVFAVIFFIALIPAVISSVYEIVLLKPVITDETIRKVTIIVFSGVCLLASGIAVYKGNLGVLHSYHYSRVIDKSSYGKSLGKALMIFGMIFVLTGLIEIFSSLHTVVEALSTIILLSSSVVFVIVALKIQVKYNGGIF